MQLKQTYTDKRWGLPGGKLEPGETVHVAIERECLEELGCNVIVRYMSGMYYHKEFNSHVCIFRCELSPDAAVKLSAEHSAYRYFALDELSPVQRHRVSDCIEFDGQVKSASF